MNLIYFRRLTFKYKLNNCDIDKIIKSINKISNDNKYIIYTKKYILFNKDNILSNKIYFYIKKNKYLKINFSHLYYDAYSIFHILNKIDLIYNNKLDNYKFNFYNNKFSYLNFISNNFELLKKINILNAIPFFTNKNKKTFRINKNELKNLSNSEIIKKILELHQINKFCLIVNARKTHADLDNLLGNLIFVTKDLDVKNDLCIKDNLRKKINYYSKKKITDLINSIPNSLIVNSYIGFENPSFVKKFYMNITSFGNLLFIYPFNNDEQFIIYDYYM